MSQKNSSATNLKNLRKYMRSRGLEVYTIKNGILGLASGSQANLVIQKNNVIRVKAKT